MTIYRLALGLAVTSILLAAAWVALLSFYVGPKYAFSYISRNPRDAMKFTTYAILNGRWREGNLKVGDLAPNVVLRELNGSEFFLHERIGAKPLVLIFGSYT